MHPYESIRTEMLRRINDQSWPAGFTLPREEDLAEELSSKEGKEKVKKKMNAKQ